MNDRIKLAEAMGWAIAAHPRDKEYRRWIDPDTGTGANSSANLPDPFTDANDDYAVLEFMRTQKQPLAEPGCFSLWYAFSKELHHSTWYKIGDYARAALKVINKEQT